MKRCETARRAGPEYIRESETHMNRQERELLIDSKRDDLTKIIAKLLIDEKISLGEANSITDAVEEVVHQERMSVHEMNDRAYGRIDQ